MSRLTMPPMRLVTALAVGALMGSEVTAQTAAEETGKREIVTSGTSTVRLAPDRVLIRVEIATRAESAAQATTTNGVSVLRVLDTLRVLGLTAPAVRTSALSIGPNIDFQNARRVVDYQAAASIDVDLNRPARIGEILEAALAAGGTGVSAINFLSDSLPQARSRALAQAFNEAKIDAETLARATGGALGDLLLITTNPVVTGNFSGRGFEGTIAAPANVLRDVMVTATVQTRWALRDR